MTSRLAPASSGPSAVMASPDRPMSALSTPAAVTTLPPRRIRSNSLILAGQEHQKLAHYGQRDPHIVDIHRLGGMMADAALAADEQHRRGRDPGEDGGVVPRAAGQADHTRPGLAGGAR